MGKESLTKTFQSVHEKISSHAGAVQGIVSAAIVTGINQLVEFAAFECPCVIKESSAEKTLSSQINSGSFLHQKRSYGYLFIFAPALLLLFLSFAFNANFWKKITACCRKVKGYDEDLKKNCCKFTKTFCNVFIVSLVIPIIWIMLSLIDGDYLACALTPSPYAFSEGQTCKTPKNKLERSNEYLSNKRYSQIVGWIASISIFLSALILYGVYRCCQSMNHIHATINSQYQKKMKEDITKAFLDTNTKKELAENETDSQVEEEADEEVLKEFVKDLKKDKNRLAGFWKELEEKLSDDYDATKHYVNELPRAKKP